MTAPSNIEADQPLQLNVDELIDLMVSIMSDGLDHPELWDQIPEFVAAFPVMGERLDALAAATRDSTTQVLLILLKAIVEGAEGQFASACAEVEELAVKNSQSALVQGVVFRLKKLRDPSNPAYDLSGTFCSVPFRQLDVLETSSHQCCASWLHASAGNLQTTGWQDVWNSATAKAIRQSIHDGTYRYCNKAACPSIAGKTLQTKEEARAESESWARIVDEEIIELEDAPETVNLAYDRTCNLACPSCRTEKYAADSKTRERYAVMQRDNILPMLKTAKTVFVTGSGDPFASKNFRSLIKDLTAEEYPDLKFQIMTNAMLLTRKQWAEFPTLHGRTSLMKVSIDAATGPTHETLRLGAKWPTMMENMLFAGELSASGDVDCYELVFTVQQDNFKEMGDAVDLAKQVGADSIYFARITNWGTFTTEQFRHKAVFMPSHPEYADFLTEMQDQRLLDPMVRLGDLGEFVGMEAPRRRDVIAA